jgi:Transglycosylase SLT domain
MTYTSKALRVVLIYCTILMLCGSLFQVEGKKRRRSKVRYIEDPVIEEPVEPEFEGVRIKLSDGTYMPVDDAWDSEQGIWYRKGGITHLLSRDRAKAIERSEGSVRKPEPQIAVIKEPQAQQAPIDLQDRPAWIYLKGGAKFEADSATESAAGVWYRRGSMSIFIEKSRIDRVEREDPESLAKLNSNRERGWSSGNPKLDSLIRQNGAKFGVDPYLIFLVMEQESHFNSRALSPKGARGLMQLMPGTAARFGVRRPHDPAQNISGGTRYLKELLTRFGNRVDLVLASYNAGEGAVIRYGHRVPPYRETRNYVKRISYRYRKAKPVVKTTTTPSSGGM